VTKKKARRGSDRSEEEEMRTAEYIGWAIEMGGGPTVLEGNLFGGGPANGFSVKGKCDGRFNVFPIWLPGAWALCKAEI
jgi:hypothetical protein